MQISSLAFVAATVALLWTQPLAAAEPGAGKRPVPKLQTTQVLCCCRVYNGGQCCAQTAACFGGFVPGCFCAPSNYPRPISKATFVQLSFEKTDK